MVGAGYVDDCFVLAANYVTSYSYAAGYHAAGSRAMPYMFQIGLRTLGQYHVVGNAEPAIQYARSPRRGAPSAGEVPVRLNVRDCTAIS